MREYLDPQWTEYSQAFSPLRKKKVEKDFPKLWAETKVKVAGRVQTYPEIFQACRKMLHDKVVLAHPDYEAAQKPLESGRPLELFVDASDYGWCGCLCQRPPGRSLLETGMTD